MFGFAHRSLLSKHHWPNYRHIYQYPHLYNIFESYVNLHSHLTLPNHALPAYNLDTIRQNCTNSINGNLKIICQWGHTNFVSFNSKISRALLIWKKAPLHHILTNMNIIQLEFTQLFQMLNLTNTKDLPWRKHIFNKANKFTLDTSPL